MFMNLLLHREDVLQIETTAVSVSERVEASRKRDFRVNVRLD